MPRKRPSSRGGKSFGWDRFIGGLNAFIGGLGLLLAVGGGIYVAAEPSSGPLHEMVSAFTGSGANSGGKPTVLHGAPQGAYASGNSPALTASSAAETNLIYAALGALALLSLADILIGVGMARSRKWAFWLRLIFSVIGTASGGYGCITLWSGIYALVRLLGAGPKLK